MDMRLTKLTAENTATFKADMRAAFRFGALAGMGIDADVLPETNIDESLCTDGAAPYMVLLGGAMIGGAIIVIDLETARGRLDFLYVKVGCQGKRVGQFIWSEIEKRHPEVCVGDQHTIF